MGQLGDLSPEGSVVVGILVGLLSTSIQSLGLTLQRKSHLLEDGKDILETRRPPYKRRRWQLGMLMFVVSNLVGSTIQITTLPLPVLSTLQASGLVFNTAFATLLLNEPFTRFSLIGTILTCVGAALIAIFGAIAEPAHSLSQLLDLLKERQFVIWMIGTLLAAVGTILFAHLLKVRSSQKHFEQHFPKLERSRSMSMSANLSSLKRTFTATLPPALQLRMSRLKLARGLSYALISGILSAHSLLLAKSAVELIVRTIVDHNNQFHHFQSWLILLALVFFALSQLYYLHLGLRLCSTSVLYPFVFCIYNIIAILDGLIYFRQASRLSGLHAGLIAVGTVILLSGVLSLSWRLDDSVPVDPAAPLELPPPDALTPGMGLIRTSEDSDPSSPLLPSVRPRSSASIPRRSTVNEQTPLLYRRPRRVPTLTLVPPPPDAPAKDIWAELEDSETSDQDILSSLPRTPSPFLTHASVRNRRRSRGNSGISPSSSSAALANISKLPRGSSGSEESLQFRAPRRFSAMKKQEGEGERRRSSAPGVGAITKRKALRDVGTPNLSQQLADSGENPSSRAESPVTAGADEARKRRRSNSAAVHFADERVPSRYDLARGGKAKAKKGGAEAADAGNDDDPGG